MTWRRYQGGQKFGIERKGSETGRRARPGIYRSVGKGEGLKCEAVTDHPPHLLTWYLKSRGTLTENDRRQFTK
jgi:hypothetical protein